VLLDAPKVSPFIRMGGGGGSETPRAEWGKFICSETRGSKQPPIRPRNLLEAYQDSKIISDHC
jgi:hypothetical protein